MDIAVNAQVQCTDGVCGHSTRVVVNPANETVTHLVVREAGLLGIERVVPIELVAEASANAIRLRCSRQELGNLEPFIYAEYVTSEVPLLGFPPTAYVMWPYTVPITQLEPFEHEHIPPGELTVKRGTRVIAEDGPVGKVDEFIVDPTTDHITHLVLREGHLWGQKDVTIPVKDIQRIEKGEVVLKLDKDEVQQLPSIQVRRWWK
jgi:sporulation protein YlmC with PRC-barrel domain